MTPPPKRVKETQRWLEVADRDLRAAELMLSDNPPLLREAVFHAHQVAEKALKAFLIWNGVPYPLTHNIRQLLKRCEVLEPHLRTALAEAGNLTEFAVQFRYPGDPPPIDEARHWLDVARHTLDEIRRRTTG